MNLAHAQLLSCLVGDRLLLATPSPPRLSRTSSSPTSFSMATPSSAATAMPATCSTKCHSRTLSPMGCGSPCTVHHCHEEDNTTLVMAFSRAFYIEAPKSSSLVLSRRPECTFLAGAANSASSLSTISTGEGLSSRPLTSWCSLDTLVLEGGCRPGGDQRTGQTRVHLHLLLHQQSCRILVSPPQRGAPLRAPPHCLHPSWLLVCFEFEWPADIVCTMFCSVICHFDMDKVLSFDMSQNYVSPPA